MNQEQKTVREIRKELQGNKKPIRQTGKPLMIYGPLSGAFYLHKDYSGITPLNGSLDYVTKAIEDGQLKGKMILFQEGGIHELKGNIWVINADIIVPQFNSESRGIYFCSGRPEKWVEIWNDITLGKHYALGSLA